MPPDELYARSGLQFLPFTTIYQLAAARGTAAFAAARTMLLIPDLIGYWLSGVAVTERTNASTTGLLDVHRRAWDLELIGHARHPARRCSPRWPRRATSSVRCGTTCGAQTGAVGGDAGDAGRVARHGLGGRRGPGRRRAVRVHRVRDVGARRRRAGRPDPDRGEPPGQLHQRGRRRRPDPLPAQRHGPVAAPGVAPDVGARGHARRACRTLLTAAAELPAGRAGLRAGRSGVPAAGRHAGPDRGRLPAARTSRRRRAGPDSSGRSSTASPPRSAGRSGTRRACPGNRWRSSTSSAAAPGTRCCAS